MRTIKKVLAGLAIALSLSTVAAPALADDGPSPDHRNTWADSVVEPDGRISTI